MSSPPRNIKDTASFARLLRTTGDERRLAILCVIFAKKKICVSEIAAQIRMSVATVSYHLRVLARTGFLRATREGKEVCYVFHDTDITSDLKKFICKYAGLIKNS